MKKRVFISVAAWLLASSALAQTPSNSASYITEDLPKNSPENLALLLNGLGSWSQQNVFTPNYPSASIPLSAINGQSGLLELASPGATLQGAGLNGLLKVTSPYTTAMLNTQNDILRVQVGNLPPSMEVGGGTNPATGGIVSALAVPAGTYNGAATWPDAAISAYTLNYNVQKSGIGIYAIGGVGGPGSFAEGINVISVNCALLSSACAPGGGFNVTNLTTLEADTVLYSPASGSITGTVQGITSQLNANVQTTGNMAAYVAIGSQGNNVSWKVGFFLSAERRRSARSSVPPRFRAPAIRKRST